MASRRSGVQKRREGKKGSKYEVVCHYRAVIVKHRSLRSGEEDFTWSACKIVIRERGN